MSRKLLVASGNKGKIREIAKYFADIEKELHDQSRDISFDIIGMGEFPDLAEVIEDGETFTANALKKARERAEATGLLTLADDSGLVVDCLDGEPGVYSARYAGEDASDLDNNRKLREELKDFPREERTAHFNCVMALVDPDTGEEIVVEGKCEGIIELEPRGENGFGYDPLFYVPEYDKTMAELPLEIKNKISHRANALKALKEEICKRW
ncbi:MAG: XTP/dITP diphosphatase [Halanaerobiales bacterium]